MSRLTCGVALAALLGVALPVPAQQASIGLAPAESATAFSRQAGRRLVFVCPAIDTPAESIWGTDVYADDSAICTAAIHSGMLRLGEAGLVAIVMGGEASAFRGDSRYGVTSASYANSDFSYTLSANTAPAAVDWKTNALKIPKEFSRPITVLCPAGGNADASIWGTGTYISDSAICVAAVHAGAITFAGGAVTVTKVPGLDSYTAYRQHDVTSIGWAAWADAFTVTTGSAAADSNSTAGGASRVIRVTGFTGTGQGTEARTRTIQLQGFTGAGTSSESGSRRITLRGWAGTGAAP